MEIKTTKGFHTDIIKFVIYGKSGIGKTTLIGTLPENELLIISAEAGLLSLSDKEIDVLEARTWEDVRNAVQIAFNDDKYKYIGIDSITEISTMLVKDLKQRPEYQNPKNALKLWGEYDEKLTAFLKYIRDSKKGMIITALPEDVQDGGFIVKKPFIKGKSTQAMLCSYFDQVFYMTRSEEGQRILRTQPTEDYEAKDRSGKLNEEEEPNLQVIIDKIKN